MQHIEDCARGANGEDLRPGKIIVVSRWKADEIAKAAGLTRPHFGMEILKVERETAAAVQLTVKLSAQRTTHCCVCGIALTNPESVANGIGPVCAENHGISYGTRSLEELADKLKSTTPVTAWLPKRAIKKVFNA